MCGRPFEFDLAYDPGGVVGTIRLVFYKHWPPQGFATSPQLPPLFQVPHVRSPACSQFRLLAGCSLTAPFHR